MQIESISRLENEPKLIINTYVDTDECLCFTEEDCSVQNNDSEEKYQYQPALHDQDLKNEHYKQSELFLGDVEVTTAELLNTEPTTIPPETGTTLTMDTTTSGPTTTTNH